MVPADVLASLAQNNFQPHWELYPRTYVAWKTSYPLLDHLDGDLTKEAWVAVPWSEHFDDIRGVNDAPANERPNANCTTRFKALWDDHHLYIGALIESDFETIAEFKERNSPIFQKDSDFEVFIDPFGTCQNYKELEVNAINTVWNLMLDKPYNDGGIEHSGRIAHPGDKDYYEVYHQKTAVRLVKGKLNQPNAGATWSVEIAISYKDVLAQIEEHPEPPKVGSAWRINFSRVEHKGDINWTWQPQIVWSPKNSRYTGFVQMHLPDAWGYIIFGEEASKSKAKGSQSSLERDLSWPGRLAAMNIYYAQAVFLQKNGIYAGTLEELGSLTDPPILAPFDIEIKKTDGGGFLASVKGGPDGSTVSVNNNRFLKLHWPRSTEDT